MLSIGAVPTLLEEDFVGAFTPAHTSPNGTVDYNEFSHGETIL